MPVSFEQLQIGETYSRAYLAQLWGYRGREAISRGVVTPAGQRVITLFVTKDMQGSSEHYNNYIDGTRLHWEGENSHANDLRVVRAKQTGDEIHLFYREESRSDFVYLGQLQLESHTLLKDRPSQFVFQISSSRIQADPLDDIHNHESELATLDETEREAVVKSRIGQGKFRDELIKLWGGCSVTGLHNLSLLRASHVKPWRDSSNRERLDPNNGLLLHPTLDHLFDRGFISFKNDGQILLSPRLSKEELKRLGVRDDAVLRKVPTNLIANLEFHREKVFK